MTNARGEEMESYDESTRQLIAQERIGQLASDYRGTETSSGRRWRRLLNLRVLLRTTGRRAASAWPARGWNKIRSLRLLKV
jgi:hypothetical protein